MAAARRLLLRTTCSVESISQDLGYLDKSHFLRQFRRRHGTTPKAWRSAYRE
ncbi:MAG: helix-turn-helix domain-containing protein [Xenococcaceae cyanobacterium]